MLPQPPGKSSQPERIRGCSGIVLAGGASRRMGTAKAWLDFDGRPLLEHLVDGLTETLPEVVVVAGPGQPLPPVKARIVFDEAPGEGPLAGLVVGLREVASPLAFVVSCDVPLLRPELVRCLLGHAAGADAVIPEWEGRLQPLVGVYRTAIQPLAAARLAAGSRRMSELLDAVRTVRVPEAELRRIDPEGWSFLNLNTPEDYARAKKLSERRLPGNNKGRPLGRPDLV